MALASELFTLDTNVLFYAVDPTDQLKHQIALKLYAAAQHNQCFIPLQVLNEFYFSATRKQVVDRNTVVDFIDTCRTTMAVVPPIEDDLLQAMKAHSDHKISFFDALLWATARRAGCRLIFSEDFQSGRQLDGVLFRNPFAIPTPDELEAILL